MKWLVSVALGLAPLAGACASMPIYGDWVINDYCKYGNDERSWVRTEAPTNANALREIARTDTMAMDEAPQGAREYWFAMADGTIKYCLTALTRGSRADCGEQRAVWWVFREAEDSPVTDGGQFKVCLT